MAPRSFKKTVVAVSGTFPGYKQGTTRLPWMNCNEWMNVVLTMSIADLKALVENQGATFNATVLPDCTHLVTTQKDVDKKSEKCMS